MTLRLVEMLQTVHWELPQLPVRLHEDHEDVDRARQTASNDSPSGNIVISNSLWIDFGLMSP